MPIRIFVADDYRLVLAGLKALVQDDATVQVIGEAIDGQSGLQLATELKPDVIVLDLSMPGMNGIRVAQALRVRCPCCHILILSVHEDRAYLRQLLDLGVSGYVLKRSAPEELIAAIRAVAAGGVYLDPTIAGMIVGRGFQACFIERRKRGERGRPISAAVPCLSVEGGPCGEMGTFTEPRRGGPLPSSKESVSRGNSPS